MKDRNPKFQIYLDLLVKWNKTYNLTAIDDPQEIWIKHFEDSLSPLPFLPARGRLLDVGTGAGFPGIPLKIERPELEVVLLDSGRKKISFCEAAIRKLGLKGIQAVHGRTDDPKIIQRLGLFDIVICRAVFSLADFLSSALPFAKPDALGIAMKGPDWKNEMQENTKWKLQQVFDYELSLGLGKRSLVIFRR